MVFLVDQLILVAGILLLIGIGSSKFSTRLGLPVLVVFLAVGMLAGEDGIGGLDFDNFRLAHAVGVLALGVILFDGGLRTRLPALRAAWKPAALLATVGVLVTALVTGLAASLVLDVPLITGMLLGSIVASTDAAAVFSVLRSQGLHLRQRIAATLEIESGSNDPMAIFLTVGLLEVITGRTELGWELAQLFLMQMGIGTIVGVMAGWLAVRVINGINLAAPGLYPVLAGACGLLAYGTAASIGGSGFLSIYIAGIIVGNSRIVFERGTFYFMDGLAWIGQITMFVVLGLLVTPTELVGVAGAGLLIAAILIVLARPLAVVPLLLPFGFSAREHLLISWVGLRGSVPIVLATFPLMYGLPDGRLVFNLIFFVVFVSATLQGWTLPALAARLGLEEPNAPAPAVSLELMALREVNAEILSYSLPDDSPVAGRMLRDIRLPEGAVVGLIARGKTMIAPRGSTELKPGDHLFVITRADKRAAVDLVFSA